MNTFRFTLVILFNGPGVQDFLVVGTNMKGNNCEFKDVFVEFEEFKLSGKYDL